LKPQLERRNRTLRATTDMFGVRWLLSRRLNYKVREDPRSTL